MLVKIAQLHTVKSENGEAETPSSNEYGTCDLTCQNDLVTWFTNSSRTQYQHHFQTCEDWGVSKFRYASSAMQNKIQGSDSSQLYLVPSISANVSTQNPRSHAHMKNVINPGAKHLEHQRSTLGLLVTTVKSLAPSPSPSRTSRGTTYPSSKCLHRFNASCAFVLQAVHSNLNTTFFVVFAFLWKTGFV